MRVHTRPSPYVLPLCGTSWGSSRRCASTNTSTRSIRLCESSSAMPVPGPIGYDTGLPVMDVTQGMKYRSMSITQGAGSPSRFRTREAASSASPFDVHDCPVHARGWKSYTGRGNRHTPDLRVQLPPHVLGPRSGVSRCTTRCRRGVTPKIGPKPTRLFKSPWPLATPGAWSRK